MSKVFYDHLILIPEVLSELDKYVSDPEEKTELIDLINQSLHHHTLDIILTHLSQDKHEQFLTRLKATPHDPSLLAFLKKEIKSDIESTIKVQAQLIKKEILAEIKKAKLKK